MAKIRANGDKVLVQVKHEEKVSKGGIILAADKEERFYEGKVINTGKDPSIAEFGIKEGDYVFYEKGTNYEVELDGVLYDLVSVFDIIAKAEEE